MIFKSQYRKQVMNNSRKWGGGIQI